MSVREAAIRVLQGGHDDIDRAVDADEVCRAYLAEHPADDVHEFGAFEQNTLHRLLTEAARYWVVSRYLSSHELPERKSWFAYPSGPVAMDWGNGPTSPDDCRPLKGKRVRITMEVEEINE